MTNEYLIIRDATLDDLPGILEIYNHAIIHTTAVYSEQPHTLEMRVAWYNDRISNGFPVFVAELNGQIVGFSTYGHFRAWPCYQYTVEHSVYVRGDARGQGIGTALLTRLVERARAQGFHVMIGALEANNGASLKLHLGQGFIETGRMPEVGRKFDRWLTLVFVQKLL